MAQRDRGSGDEGGSEDEHGRADDGDREDEQSRAGDAAGPGGLVAPGRAARRVQAVEVGVFLLLILPALVLGAMRGAPRALGFAATAVTTIAQDAGLVSLVLYFLWRSGEPLQRLGLRAGDGLREVLIGVLLFWPAAYATAELAGWLGRLGLSGADSTLAFLEPRGFWQVALAVALVSVVAVAEEIVFRGYLLLRFRPLLRSTAGAVILSSAVFGLGHGYEGAAGMVSVATLGAVYALVYLWRGSLLAPIVMHFLQDLVGIVLPGLGR